MTFTMINELRLNAVFVVVFFFLSSVLAGQHLQIPTIGNVSLVPRLPSNITTIINSTCDQCLCLALERNAIAVNCFLSNDTCQLFDSLPKSYRLRPVSQSILSFPRGSLPPPGQCCMTDFGLLRASLLNATVVSVNVSSPRCILIDDQDRLVNVENGGTYLNRFHPDNLTLIDRTLLPGSTTTTIAYHQGAYFIGKDDNTILIVNSDNLSTINVLTAPNMSSPRDMIFLQDGRVMVLCSSGNDRFLFFNRSSSAPINYHYDHEVITSYSTPHGLWFVNDSFFYATSWNWNTIYSHSTTDGRTWNESLFANGSNFSSVGQGSHVMVDDCQRKWLSMYDDAFLTFDNEGHLLGNFTPPWNKAFDAIFTRNYVMFVSDWLSNRLIRLDPHVEC